jgi:hypothetical protein
MNKKILTEFRETLRLEGLRSAIRLLNEAVVIAFQRSTHFEVQFLRNVCLVDKEEAYVSHASTSSFKRHD